MKTMLIINPVSGKGLIKNYLLNIVEALGKGGNEIAVYVTEKNGDATEFAFMHGSDFEKIVCNGGDGTLSEVLNGIMRLPEEARPVVGYIPLGTTNDMASSFSLPRTTEEVIEHVAADNVRIVDVGQINSRYFGYVSAFGAFTEISYITPQADKNNWGYLAYMVNALGSIQNVRSVHAKIKWDNGEIEDDFIFGAIVNSTRVAGVIQLPIEDVALDDGLFEVLLIRMPKDIVDLNLVISDVLTKTFNTDNTILLHSKAITFEFSEPVAWTVDGEDGGKHDNVVITNHNKALKLLV